LLVVAEDEGEAEEDTKREQTYEPEDVEGEE
jgi:hypothetical protein